LHDVRKHDLITHSLPATAGYEVNNGLGPVGCNSLQVGQQLENNLPMAAIYTAVQLRYRL